MSEEEEVTDGPGMALWGCWCHPYIESVEKNRGEISAGRIDTSKANLVSTGDGY